MEEHLWLNSIATARTSAMMDHPPSTSRSRSNSVDSTILLTSKQQPHTLAAPSSGNGGSSPSSTYGNATGGNHLGGGVDDDDEATHVLRADEINACRHVFEQYQTVTGRISLWHLRKALKELEIQPAEDELFKMIEQMQEEEMKPSQSPPPSSHLHTIMPSHHGNSSRSVKSSSQFTLVKTGTIDFEQFVSIVESQRKQDRPIHDNETLSAFVAMGGNSDRTGAIQTEKLTAACQEFGLTIDIDALIREVDDDGNGTVDFDEFTMMLSTSKNGSEDDNDNSYHRNGDDNSSDIDSVGGAGEEFTFERHHNQSHVVHRGAKKGVRRLERQWNNNGGWTIDG